MSMVVKNNMSAISTLNTLNKNSSALSKSLQKVSSGMKINSAADDASGYAISERMRVQIRSLDQANANTQSGNSMMKVAEGAVSSTVDILKTLKEKVINAANDTNTDSDRQTIQKELDQSIDQIDDNANVTFNGKYLLDGSKNNVGEATYTALSNQNLSKSTTADTKLVDLKARNEDSLELLATDRITVSYVQAGKTYSATFQVGDKTLQDIFNEAENIDTDSQIFATSSNEAIQKASGVTNASTTDAENKAIDYLKQQLATGGVKFNDNTLATPTEVTTITAANGGSVTLADADNYADAEGNVYEEGDLHKAVRDAQKAVDKATAAIGSYTAGATTNSGTAGTLGTALEKAGISWDGKASSLDSATMEEKLQAAYAEPTNDGLKEAVAAYREDVSDLAKAKDQQAVANANYVKASDQLDALTKQKTVNDAQATSNALRSAFETTAAIKIDDTANTKLAYTVVAKLKTDGTVDDADKTAKAAANTTDDLRTAVKNELSSLLDKVEAAGVLSTGTGSVEEILDTYKGGANGTTDLGLKALATAGYKAAVAAVKTAKDGLNGNAASGATKDDGTAMKVSDALKSAQEEVVSKFSGPQLMTGANVGVNAAGQIVSTASGENAITITANKAGIGGQISGLNIRIADAQGNLKKSAEASLDAFSETVRAQNKSEDNAISLQVGAQANQAITIGLTDMRSEALGLKGADGTKLNISTRDKANAAINVLDNAISKALDQQTTIGSIESRLSYTSSNLTTSSENVQASESTIRDADMAKEMTEYTKNNVLLQAAQSMLAQANQSSSSVLSLLQ
ncbi:flagellin [Selenomonas ruminantium]|uniref:flagellin N-terminal helical domain-containing protein n=1 Tax=Selenomonas ruminantium TaxID=971 RepID=UPI0034E95F4B